MRRVGERMKHIYKVRPYRIVVNLLMGLASSLAIYFIVRIWLRPLVCLAIAVGLYLLILVFSVMGNMITVTVTDQFFMVKKGNKIRKFNIETSQFYPVADTSAGETSCEITVTEADGTQTFIDLDLIGKAQFYKILEDLGITGEKSEIHKVETKRVFDVENRE